MRRRHTGRRGVVPTCIALKMNMEISFGANPMAIDQMQNHVILPVPLRQPALYNTT